LELGTDSVQNIAKKAGIHRVTTYDILESLLAKNMVSQIDKGKKRYFSPADPQHILSQLKNKEEIFAELLPELQAVQNKGPKKTRVMYYEGKEAVLEAYWDRIRHQTNDQENLVCGSSERIAGDYPKFFDRFTQERLARGIRAKIIVEKSDSGLREEQMSQKQAREVKFWPAGKKFQANTIVYGNRVMIISWESMMLVIIEDQSYADNQRMIFNLLWQYLPA
jgi:sugar-specific transcriptional regulator TrmB